MIVRVYGSRIEGVEPTFSAVSINNLGFRRNGTFTMAQDEFDQEYERAEGHELTASAEGPVQLDVEKRLLEELETQLNAIHEGLAGDQVLMIESERGVDEPRTREKKETHVVDGENRLYFHWWVDPPLRLGVFRKRG